MTELVQFFRHSKCGDKVQIIDGAPWCPTCRHSTTGENLTMVSFENPVVMVIPNRENLDAPEERLHGHSRYSGSVHGADQG